MKKKLIIKLYAKPNTKEEAQAMIIRILRRHGCTWGRIGELCALAFNLKEYGGQMLGKELCDGAAKLFDEDPKKEPWN